MSWTSALFAAGGIKNIDKIAFAVIGFFIFIIMMISIGIFAVTSALSLLVGIYMLLIAVYLFWAGPRRWAIPFVAAGAFLTIIRPEAYLTVGDLMRALGMEPNIILMFTPALVVVPNSIKKISREVINICGNN